MWAKGPILFWCCRGIKDVRSYLEEHDVVIKDVRRTNVPHGVVMKDVRSYSVPQSRARGVPHLASVDFWVNPVLRCTYEAGEPQQLRR